MSFLDMTSVPVKPRFRSPTSAIFDLLQCCNIENIDDKHMDNGKMLNQLASLNGLILALTAVILRKHSFPPFPEKMDLFHR